MTDPTRRTTDTRALAEVLGERARDESPGAEPTTEELVAHLEGRLTDDETADLERRLAASPEATRDLLDLAELMEVEESLARDDDPPADLEVERAWRSFREELNEGDGPVAAGRRPRRSPRLTLARFAAIAAIAVVALALGVWIGQLGVWHGWDGSDTGSGDLVATRTVALFGARSGDSGPHRVELAAGERLALLLAPPDDCDGYTVEIAHGDTGRVSRLDGLEPVGDTGALELTFDAAPGRYTVELLGCGRTLLAEEIEIDRRTP